jgi:WD40 repeat protein
MLVERHNATLGHGDRRRDPFVWRRRRLGDLRVDERRPQANRHGKLWTDRRSLECGKRPTPRYFPRNDGSRGEIQQNSDTVVPVSLSGDCSTVFAAGPEKSIRMWSATSGAPIRDFEGLANPTGHVAVSDDRRWLVTAAEDKSARLWDLSHGCAVRSFRGHEEQVDCLAVSRDNKWLITGGGTDDTTRLWDLARRGDAVHVFRHPGNIGYVFSVAISGDSKWVVSGSYDGTTLLWNRATGEQVRAFPNHKGWVNSVNFSSDDKLLVTGAHDGARLSNAATARRSAFSGKRTPSSGTSS